jgi:hypothetical protein
MKNPLNRRAALGSLTAAGAVLAAPRIAKAENSPSAISLAFSEFRSAEAHWKLTSEAEDQACRRYKAPELPGYYPSSDVGGRIILRREDGSRCVKLSVSDENLDDLRAQVATQLARPDPETGASVVRQIERTIAKIEDWRAEDQRRRAAAGIPEVDVLHTAASNRVSDAAAAVEALEPTSVRDLAMQAARVLWRRGGELEDGVALFLRRVIALAAFDSKIELEAGPWIAP